MKSKEDIKVLMDYFSNSQATPVTFDEEAIVSAYQEDTDNQSLAIKILSVFGGMLASLAFLGFVFIAGLYDSDVGLLLFAGVLIAGSIWINREYDSIIMDTVSVSCFAIGFVLIGLGLEKLDVNENTTTILFIIVALSTLCIVQNYILSFVSILIINGSILSLIISNNGYNLVHIHVSVLAITLVYLFLKEAKIIISGKNVSKLYNPVRIGLIFSLLSGLFILGKRGVLPVSTDYIWISSIVIIALIVYLISTLFQVLYITETRHKISIYILTVFTLLPTALSPAISGAILIILLSFMANYKTGYILGIISFLYFISQYYYDLNFTLLTKSILLFSSGVLFIILYLFIYKKLTPDEKI